MGTSTRVQILACIQMLGGSGGMVPPENFFEYDAVRQLLRLFWGPKHHYKSLLYVNGLNGNFKSPGNRVKEWPTHMHKPYSKQRRPRMYGHHAQTYDLLISEPRWKDQCNITPQDVDPLFHISQVVLNEKKINSLHVCLCIFILLIQVCGSQTH